MPGVTADSVRLEFIGGYEIETVERLVAPSSAPTPETLGLVDLRHSRLGQVLGGVEPLDLDAGESLDLRAALPEGSEPADLFLYLKTSSATGRGLRAELATGPGLPTEFALGQNKPNPFGEGTVIRFAVASKSPVSIEVFDVHGRRVRTLIRGPYAAGYHTVTWNGRDNHDRRLSAGIYLYRMTAGSFRTSRKMALMP